MNILKHKATIFTITFLIIASFCLGSVYEFKDDFNTFSNDDVGWSGNKPIKNVEFLKYKELLSKEKPLIKNQDVIKKIGERYSLLQYAKNEMNILVSDEAVIQEISNDKKFFANGKFDKEIYLKHLKEYNMTPKYYETNVKENLTLKELLKLTNLSSLSSKSNELSLKSLFQVLNIDLYEVNYLFQDSFPVDRKDIIEYYENNKSEFLTPVSYSIKIDKYEKSKEYIDEKYQNYKNNPIVVYDIKQILVNSNDDIVKIKGLLETNSFEDLAKEYSIDKVSSVNGGLIDGIREEELTPEFRNGLKSIDLGETFVTRSGLGYHLIKKEKVLDENIDIETYKKYFDKEINETFYSDIENDLIKPSVNENIVILKDTLNELFNNNIEENNSKIIGQGDYLEKMTIIEKIESEQLDVNDINDFFLIKNYYENKMKLEKALKLSFNIEKEYLKKENNFISKKSITINKNTNLPQELLDLIYTTKIGERNDIIINNKYYVFDILSEQVLEVKNKEFLKIINTIYNYESGYLLIDEAKKKYPIKISKNLL